MAALLDQGVGGRAAGGHHAGGVVSALRARAVGNAHALESARLPGGESLAFDHRHAIDAEGARDVGGAAADDPPKRRASAHFFEQPLGALPIAPGDDAGLHRHTDSVADFDRVEADVIAEAVEFGDLIGGTDLAVRPQERDRLELKRGGDVVAVLIVEEDGALDDASGHAGEHLAAAFAAQPFDLLAADRVSE